ncbi:MAG TPA: phosphatase PAP2 family protein [Allosphingosinicella sp.]|nr:phosphatase PAP2 family protein [Allosphingosinicella sp.]
MNSSTGGDRRAVTALWTLALFFALLAAAGLAGLDQIVAGSLSEGAVDSFWGRGVTLLDGLALRDVGDFLLGFALVLAGLLLLVMASTRSIGFPLLYVGLVQLLAYVAADMSKPWFGRVRPSEALSGSDLWFAAGNSFPSGHTAFYAGLFLPLILLFPRLSPLWAIPPLFVAAARVMERDHYLSDVSASLALAAALAALLAFVAEKGRD